MKPLSKCCNAYLKVCSGDEGTSYWKCATCGLPSDPKPQEAIGEDKRCGHILHNNPKAYCPDCKPTEVPQDGWLTLEDSQACKQYAREVLDRYQEIEKMYDVADMRYREEREKLFKSLE